MIQYDFKQFDQIDIFGISDLHMGHPGWNEPEFQKMSRFILAEPNRFIVLGGDLVDNQVKSSKGSPFEATMSPSKQREMAAEILHPLRDRTLVIIPGNHEESSVKDTDSNPAEMIAERLDILERYRRDLAYLSISVGERKNHKYRPTNYCVCNMHGRGAGRLMGSGLNIADASAAVMGADLFIMGHTHKSAIAPGSRFECKHSQGVMVQRDYQVMINTAWLDYVGYAVRNMYRPTPNTISRATLYGGEFGIETHNRTS
jgi:UDP-2,3-diacylglucosamine pyrophosphatase LpxH